MAAIGFIGLGNMGSPMALNLAKAGHGVTGFDVGPSAQDAARHAGITLAANAADAAREADIVMSMLPNGQLVQLVHGEILNAVAPGMLLIDCSTIDVSSARAAHAAADTASFAALNALVSGGVAGASAPTFMAGGTPESFAAAEPVLAVMGKQIVHCGLAGAGQAAKICKT